MNKNLALSAVLFLTLASNLFAQDIPKSAVILEKRNVTANRQFILWMPNPKKVPRETDDEIYTCPEETRGSYYSGIAKVSLFDLKTKKIINTIEIAGNGISSDDNTLDLPYWIHRGIYEVPKLDDLLHGKPILINLKDYNSDGKAFEFALFDAVACMGLETTLIGYSQKQDKVIQYEIELKTDDGTSKVYWVDSFFGQKADKKGVWKYNIDYRGRGGAYEMYEIRYDKQKESFYGRRTSIFEDDGKKPHK